MITSQSPRVDERIDPDSLSEIYHENTKMWPALIASGPQVSEHDKYAMARSYKLYPWLPQIALPRLTDCALPGMSLAEALAARRSIRQYTGGTVTTEQLSLLLHYSYGENYTPPGPYGQRFRTAPSGGGLYPLEIYSAVFAAEGVSPGLYHYNVPQHGLELLQSGDTRDEVLSFTFGNEAVAGAAVVFLVTAVFRRNQIKYGPRGYRLILLDAGHLMQNLLLAATALGLGACSLGGFFDDRLNAFVGADGVDESGVYIGVVGQTDNRGPMLSTQTA